MAYIVEIDYEFSLGKTEVDFFADDKEKIELYFKESTSHPGGISKKSWSSGSFIDPSIMPSKVNLIKGKMVYDFLVMLGGATIVSSSFKNAVREIGDESNQFFPVDVYRNSELVSSRKYFIFNVSQQIDSVIESESNFEAVGRGIIPDWGYTRRPGGWRCTLNAEIIQNRALWMELRLPKYWLVSDRFALSAEKSRFIGFKYSNFCRELLIR